MRILLHLNIIVGRLDMLLLQRIVVLISKHLPFVLLQMGVILFMMMVIIIFVVRRWLVGLVRRRLILILDLVDVIACNWLLQGGTVEIAVPLIVN